MDTDPKLTRKDAVRRAEHLAEEHLPSWLRAANPEGRLPVLYALITAIALQLAIPVRYTLAPRWPLITMEVLLLVVLVILNPGRLTRSTQLGRYTSWALLAAITIDKHGLGGAAELPDRDRPCEQQRRGAAGQRRGDLHHQHHRVRHLVLGAGQRRSVHPAYPQAPVPGLHVPTDGQSRTRAPKLGAQLPRLSLRQRNQRDGFLAHRHHAAGTLDEDNDDPAGHGGRLDRPTGDRPRGQRPPLTSPRYG